MADVHRSSRRGDRGDGGDRRKGNSNKKGGIFDALRSSFDNRPVKDANTRLENVDKLFKTVAEGVGKKQRSESRKISAWLDSNPGTTAENIAQGQEADVQAKMAAHATSLQETYDSFTTEREGISRDLIIRQEHVDRANAVSERYGRHLTLKSVSISNEWTTLSQTNKTERDYHTMAFSEPPPNFADSQAEVPGYQELPQPQHGYGPQHTDQTQHGPTIQYAEYNLPPGYR